MKNTARVFSAISGLGFFLIVPIFSLHASPTFTNEAGIRIVNATPQAIDSSTSPARMYFIRDFNVLSATSSDGLSWAVEGGVRLSSATDGGITVSSITGFSLLSVSTGGYQGVFSDIDSSGSYRVHAATSSDGIRWAIAFSTPVAPASTATFVGSPKLFKISNSNWRLYFVKNTDATSNPATRAIYTSQSTDEGQSWSTGTVALANQAGEVTVSSLTNANVRVLYTAPLAPGSTNTRILSGLADNLGVSFVDESGVRLSTGAASGFLSFPLIVRSTESFRWRLYYAFTVAGSSVPNTFSALTLTPDPQSVTPSSMLRTDPPGTLTVRGEIFSPAPTVKITKSGQSDVAGASVSRTNDQTITAVFDPLNLELGTWAMVVTNSDSIPGTLNAGVTITFSGGSVNMIDNLLRPVTGAQTRIEVTIFEAGRVKINIYTMEGRLVRNLFDGDAAIGTTTFRWDGKNDDGNLVASGAYLVKMEGPKLKSLQKIVVVK